MYSISARRRSPWSSPDGREISGFDEIVASRWSPPIRSRRSRSWNTVSVALCPGRKQTSSERPANSSALAVAHERTVDLRPGAPGAERQRHRLQRARHLLRDAVAQHRGGGEVVLGGGLVAVALEERHEPVERHDLGAGAVREYLHEPDVVDVLVGHDDPLEVLDPVAESGQPALEHVERAARVRAGVDQRERLVLDQVHVHAPDGERRGDGDPVDAGGRGGCVGVVAHSADSTCAAVYRAPGACSRPCRCRGSWRAGRRSRCAPRRASRARSPGSGRSAACSPGSSIG